MLEPETLITIVLELSYNPFTVMCACLLLTISEALLYGRIQD